MFYKQSMDEFNYENAAEFLKECREKGPKTESVRQILLRLAPVIRDMAKEGFTQKEVHELLVEKYGLPISFSTFRGYLRQAGQTEDEEEDRCRGPR